MSAAATEEPQIDAGGQVMLFNAKFEGKKITDYAVNFGGNIPVADPDLVKELTLDSTVRLIVEARVVSRGHKLKGSKDGAASGVVSMSNLVVETITLDT